ncbi:GNAT family N-acetyltransferase [uncultured Thiocystis sp.]|jgi:N-acetylglutamate synthase-like GNAT family acetyltransferase|uniref:GNAT family N-acetyltransferase n=1 Tax=uncultured Thiocystis sp. TaxID=1202134 RepID=UPI0025CC72EA|nr:GNAT family N-acetyltransferase [uncultured Thiocystis sp.]
MNNKYSIEQRQLLSGCLPQLHVLLDRCYSRPPRDVFYRLIEQYRTGFPAWLARSGDGRIIGFIHLAPNSKGGTLETLAVDPDFRHLGIARALVNHLLDATSGVVSLTTRIPAFFATQGFQSISVLPDQSVFMIHVHFDREDLLPSEVIE